MKRLENFDIQKQYFLQLFLAKLKLSENHFPELIEVINEGNDNTSKSIERYKAVLDF